MTHVLSHDPRAVRTRAGLQQAFKDLLDEKPFHKITVTDIAEQAGFARHTFYNHYETKEDILNHLIVSFFQVWQDNPGVVRILNKIDVIYCSSSG